jgi:hypothetical protein
MKTPAGFAIAALAGLAVAGPPPLADAIGKTGYTLWNPVPREQMREMSTDRPDQTESPYTVDAGHVQLEMDLASFTRDHAGDGTVEEWNIAPINFKVGIWHNLDMQFVLGGWVRSEIRRPGESKEVTDGIGDLTVRAKANLWGNDGGPTALAVMPFVKVPLKSDAIGNDEVEGGLIVPFGWNVAERIYLGLMTEIDLLADEDSSGHHLEWLNSITVGIEITDRVGVYVELVGVLPEGGDDRIAQFDAGLTYAVSDDIQLDAGCNFGLTDAAPDYLPFVGLSIRF